MTQENPARFVAAPRKERAPAARSDIASFIVMDVMRAAAELEAKGRSVIHMEVGQPGTPAPAAALAAARSALDTETLGSLENALEEFPGCAVVISHDRWFLDRTCTHILAWEGNVTEGQWYWYEGNFEGYEQNKVERLGPDAARPHRVTHRKLTRD